MIELRGALVVLALSLLGATGPGGVAMATPREVRSSVAWVRDGRVYLSLADSSAVAPGDRLTFVYRGRTIAAAVVARVYDRDLALARLTSGSLAKARRLDRLRISAEPTPPESSPPGIPVLRIAYPAGDRSSLVVTCGPSRIRSPSFADEFRVEETGAHAYRLTRPRGVGSGVPWPDTLLVRLFDEAADEEIALERGELDVAVFWPGELSAHARENPRWQHDAFGIRARGIVAATWAGAEASGASEAARADSLDLAALDQELFRGDLMPWPGAANPLPAAGTTPPLARSGWWPRPARFAVDSSLPGQRVIERFLNRDRASSTAPDARMVRIDFLDVPPGAADSLGRGDTHVSPLFALRCPIVCATALRPTIEALGGDALVNLITCEPAARRP